MNTKTAVGIALIGYCVIAGIVMIAGSNKTTPLLANQAPANNPNPTINSIILSASEVAKHNSASDCWMIVNGNVYDFTNFLGAHPGGAGTMIPYCGADGSVGFATKDRQPARNHSGGAAALLPSYYLGRLNSTITTPATAAPPANPNNLNVFGGEND